MGADEEPVSAFSDDENENEWVDEVMRLLGDSPRRAPSAESRRMRTQGRAEPQVHRAAAPRTVAHRVIPEAVQQSRQRAPPSPVGSAGSSICSGEAVSPQPPASPRVSEAQVKYLRRRHGYLPPRPPAPTISLPCRPAADEVPEDVDDVHCDAIASRSFSARDAMTVTFAPSRTYAGASSEHDRVYSLMPL